MKTREVAISIPTKAVVLSEALIVKRIEATCVNRSKFTLQHTFLEMQAVRKCHNGDWVAFEYNKADEVELMYT